MKYPEDRAATAELSKFLDAEAQHERHCELVAEYAEFLVRKDPEFNPWTRKHFEEALANAAEARQLVAWATTVTAIGLGLDNEYANHLALTSIKNLVRGYWLQNALIEAERYVTRS